MGTLEGDEGKAEGLFLLPSKIRNSRYLSPHPSRLRRATFPQGKAIYILKYSKLIQHFVLKNALSYPCLSPHTLLDTEGHAR